jgi:hypothetical protein
MSELSWAVPILAGFLSLAPLPVDSTPPLSAKATLARFRELTGDWEEKSTEGWTGHLSIRVIGRGSAVLFTSSISAHPGADEKMATLIHPDGDRLLLTHYCVAGNQPRLAATTSHEDMVEFTFLDGTNLPSRDAGHMDRVVFRFLDRDHYSSRWSWYEKGQERWMEEISYRRRR